MSAAMVVAPGSWAKEKAFALSTKGRRWGTMALATPSLPALSCDDLSFDNDEVFIVSACLGHETRAGRGTKC